MSNEINIVNGSVVGVHLGTPMQDATPDKPEDNLAHATELNTVTRVPNSEEVWDEQPKPIGGASSWNDLTDKPFDSGYTKLLDEFTVDNFTYYEQVGISTANTPIDAMLEDGMGYSAVVDGVEYKNLTAFSISGGGVCIGDKSLADGTTEQAVLPFVIITSREYDWYFYHMSDKTTHTFSIFGEVVHKIDEKFLPDSVKTLDLVFDVETVSEKYWEEYGEALEILDAVKSGKNVRFIVTKNGMPLAIMPAAGFSGEYNEIHFSTVLAYDQNGLVSNDVPSFWHRVFLAPGTFTNYGVIPMSYNS